MKNILILSFYISIILFLLLTGCSSTDINTDAPNCIQNKIDGIINNEVTSPPTEVWKWEVDTKTYYYFTSDCCDQYNYLFNDNCEVVCAPDGGIIGTGDKNCPEFKNPIKKTLIWKDSRK
jgi:hypothetical protein